VEAASRLGEVISHKVIPAPHADLAGLFAMPQASTKTSQPPTVAPHLADLNALPVAQLRQLVRQLPDPHLKGREVSRANKKTLIAELHRATADESR
jgi:microcompartment protein CcmL/EutN